MKASELKRLRALALHTIEERQARDAYNQCEAQLRAARTREFYTEKKLDGFAERVERLRLALCKIRDDNYELNGGHFPAISYLDALEKVAELASELLAVSAPE